MKLFKWILILSSCAFYFDVDASARLFPTITPQEKIDFAESWIHPRKIKPRKIKTEHDPHSIIGPDDHPEYTATGSTANWVYTLPEMETLGLTQGKLKNAPWSDDWWPTVRGILGARYADPLFPNDLKDWKKNFNYIQAYPANSVSPSSPSWLEWVDRLSPSEKYDLLIGDPNFTLTKRMWKEGAEVMDEYGSVADWIGICHGWGSAAYRVPRPKNTVTLLAADGITKIPFYPSDIKALASLLWANADYSIVGSGNRCYKKNPPADSSGHVKAPECLDNNPATWHLVMTNELALNQRGFVFDMIYDEEVWNQPLSGYSYTYFHPQTLQPFATLKDAIVDVSLFPEDARKSYRTPGAKWIVGVTMNVQYLGESKPSHNAVDSEAQDVVLPLNYVYDLELDASGRLIGGEWHTSEHPDFLWAPEGDVIPDAYSENSSLEPWISTSIALPLSWQLEARSISRWHTPTRKIVDALVKQSLISKNP